MAYIQTISPRRATGETAETYRAMHAMTGSKRAAKIVQLFSIRPGSMRRMIRLWELAMWSGEEPRTHRELVAAAVSRFAECHY
jgi:alkylhydroperoxidase family enzyme